MSSDSSGAEMTEDQEQAYVIRWANTKPWGQFLIHIANETVGGRSRVLRNVALGVRKGVPDLLLPIPMHGYHSLWIEMKRMDGGTVSKSQEAWIKALNQMGHLAVVCHGGIAAIAVLSDYMNEPNTDETEHEHGADAPGGGCDQGDQGQA